MINEEKIRIYMHYEGNEDYFGRCGSPEHKAIVTYDDFSVLSDLVQDIILLKRNLTAKSYTEEVNRKIQLNKLSEEMIELLYNKFKNGYKSVWKSK